MVLAVPNPAHPAAKGAAEHGKDVGPLATATPALLHQSPDIAVAGEAFLVAAVLVLALVELDARGTAGLLLGRGRGGTDQLGVVRAALGVASLTRGVADKREEVAFEPSGCSVSKGGGERRGGKKKKIKKIKK